MHCLYLRQLWDDDHCNFLEMDKAEEAAHAKVRHVLLKWGDGFSGSVLILVLVLVV